MNDWLENDSLFTAQLANGHHWAEHVAARLEETGLDVQVTPLTIRNHIDDRHRYNDEHDITVHVPLRVEVKSRAVAFTGPHDYPHQTAFVYSVRGWQAKTHKPVAVVLVSQATGGMAVVPAKSEPRWTITRADDHVRGFGFDVYQVDRRELRSFDSLTTWLLSR